MSKLTDLRSKGEMMTLSNGLEIIITPLTIDEEAELAEMQKDDKVMKAIAHMVKQAIKRAIPDATDEEIQNLNKDDLKKITEVVLQVNGLKSDDKKKLNTNSPIKKE